MVFFIIMEGFAIIVEVAKGHAVKKELERCSVSDKSRRAWAMPGTQKIAIPVSFSSKLTGDGSSSAEELIDKIFNRPDSELQGTEFKLERIMLPCSKKNLIKTPAMKLKECLREFLIRKNFEWTSALEKDIPKHWEIHGDLVLLPDTTFCEQIWEELGSEVWPLVCECLQKKRLARKTVISRDGFRTPQVQLLHGDSGWVQHVDNGIIYSYDAVRCMFSAGNITEKLRVASFRCEGETVVDLYAGIGYFTLPYLVHAKAGHVHACEWNPDAVEALRRNLVLNGVENRCTVYFGDNRKTCPRGVADRVNLGLVPSSEPGWFPACAALKSGTGGILHIHGNIEDKGQGQRSTAIENSCEFQKNMAHHENSSNSDVDPNHGALNKDGVCLKDDSAEGNHGNMCSMLLKSDCSNICYQGSDGEVSSGTVVRNISSGQGTDGSPSIENTDRFQTGNVFDDEENHSVSGSAKSEEHAKVSTSIDKDGNNKHIQEYVSFTTQGCVSVQRKIDLLKSEKSFKWSKQKPVLVEWSKWAEGVSQKIRGSLAEIHGGQWLTTILHIEHEKSYAPHVSHLVLDLECRPSACVLNRIDDTGK